MEPHATLEFLSLGNSNIGKETVTIAEELKKSEDLLNLPAGGPLAGLRLKIGDEISVWLKSLINPLVVFGKTFIELEALRLSNLRIVLTLTLEAGELEFASCLLL